MTTTNPFFATWLKEHREKDTPIGDLARFATPYHETLRTKRSRYGEIKSYFETLPGWNFRFLRCFEISWEAYRRFSADEMHYSPTEMGGHSVEEMRRYVGDNP